MGMTSHAEWSGLGFAPFSLPDLPLTLSDRRSFITEWCTSVADEERRRASRCSQQCELFMIDPTFADAVNPLPLRGECINLSSDGLYAIVPIGYGLAIGQQYVFQLRDRNRDIETLPQTGTIVRIDLLIREGEDQLGIGVRLNGPLFT